MTSTNSGIIDITKKYNDYKVIKVSWLLLIFPFKRKAQNFIWNEQNSIDNYNKKETHPKKLLQ